MAMTYAEARGGDYNEGYKDGCRDTNRGLVAALNRLRGTVRIVPGDDTLTERADAYLTALDDVAMSHGLRKQTTTTYVI